jgi:hypothetical protein
MKDNFMHFYYCGNLIQQLFLDIGGKAMPSLKEFSIY